MVLKGVQSNRITWFEIQSSFINESWNTQIGQWPTALREVTMIHSWNVSGTNCNKYFFVSFIPKRYNNQGYKSLQESWNRKRSKLRDFKHGRPKIAKNTKTHQTPEISAVETYYSTLVFDWDMSNPKILIDFEDERFPRWPPWCFEIGDDVRIPFKK